MGMANPTTWLSCTSLGGFKSQFYSLISQESKGNNIRDFGPIDLVGSLYKLLVKILVDRLKVVIVKVVPKLHHHFFENRQVLDAVLVVNDVIELRTKIASTRVVTQIEK